MKRVALVLLVAAVAAGCGKKEAASADSAEACMRMFTKAVESGDMDAAADLFDYVAYAKASNEDWDVIATGQQNKIIGELKKWRREWLESRFSGVKKLSFEQAGESGGQVTFTLSADGSVLGPVVVGKGGAGWKITQALGVEAG